jgi:hypothetical protein
VSASLVVDSSGVEVTNSVDVVSSVVGIVVFRELVLTDVLGVEEL